MTEQARAERERLWTVGRRIAPDPHFYCHLRSVDPTYPKYPVGLLFSAATESGVRSWSAEVQVGRLRAGVSWRTRCYF